MSSNSSTFLNHKNKLHLTPNNSNSDISQDFPDQKITSNEILKDYTIKGELGKGTFSTVYLATKNTTLSKVAIKILEKSKIINQDDLTRVLREISILKSFNSPNVIKIYEIIENPTNYYIIMEFCEYGELFNHIVEEQRLSEEESSYFFYQLINGLEYIHHNNVVHRDLKPENLLISGDNLLKIIDFGLSNYFDGKKLLSTPCGSPCYASPEMVSGNNYNGFNIDVWATGIILYAMLCGYLPFEDNDNEILFRKILECNLDLPDFLSNRSKNMIKKLLVVDPEKRIKIEGIKKHPFYLQGKKIFNELHPDVDIENKFEEKNTNIEREKNNDNIIDNNIKEDKEININKEIKVNNNDDNLNNNNDINSNNNIDINNDINDDDDNNLILEKISNKNESIEFKRKEKSEDFKDNININLEDEINNNKDDDNNNNKNEDNNNDEEMQINHFNLSYYNNYNYESKFN